MVLSNCCSAPLDSFDVCSDCKEHSAPMEEEKEYVSSVDLKGHACTNCKQESDVLYGEDKHPKDSWMCSMWLCKVCIKNMGLKTSGQKLSELNDKRKAASL